MKGLSIALLLFSVLTACGGENNLQSVDEPEFVVDENPFIVLEMPTDIAKNKTQTSVRLRNSGDGILKIVAFDLVDTPDRLIVLGARGKDCKADLTCDGVTNLDTENPQPLVEPICLTATKTCRATGFGALPLEIGPQLTKDITLLIGAGDLELDCKEPTFELPDSIESEDFCGKIHIETNAINSVGLVKKGVADIFILRPAESSGQIKITPQFVEFKDVAPGIAETQSVTIQNEGQRPLNVTSISVEKNGDWFKITGQGGGTPISIDPGQSKVWDIELTVPTDQEDFDFSTTLFVDSSAANAASGRIVVDVTAGGGSAPDIQFDATPIKFAPATQTVTITNDGEATLSLNGLTIKPAAARPFYTFAIDGNDVTNAINVTIQKGTSKDLEITFLRPDLNTDASTAVLEINHNDSAKGFKSEIVLLGDEGDVAIGEIRPESFTFLAKDGNTSSRDFAIRNIGTAPLVITAANLTTELAAEFTITNAIGTIAPGELKKGSVSFSGANSTGKQGLLEFDSDHRGGLFDLALRAVETASEVPVPVIVPGFEGNAKIGFAAKFSNTGSTPAANTQNGVWTLLSRPATSKVWVSIVGDKITVKPDVAGVYEIGLLLNVNSREAQAVLSFTAE